MRNQAIRKWSLSQAVQKSWAWIFERPGLGCSFLLGVARFCYVTSKFPGLELFSEVLTHRLLLGGDVRQKSECHILIERILQSYYFWAY
ncbi:hypothetical protein HMPREF9104_01052 [Lentilactobacillus kisonensis F0435]|uniref:Uncharacterized protein n=1 Tax=Lentilactobacillus kisonensis F0435 TaxID=797516 RepID=H1LEM6_9LACO|nr:hypothetical protein HMPREF9104_01052 [Lentilactobacillus kisonensis F0435]